MDAGLPDRRASPFESAGAGEDALVRAYRDGMSTLVATLYPYLMAQTGEGKDAEATRKLAQSLFKAWVGST